MNDMRSCRSCGMPISNDEEKGTDRGGSKSHDYCAFCYKDGEFQSSYRDIVNYSLDHPGKQERRMTKEQAETKIKTHVQGFER